MRPFDDLDKAIDACERGVATHRRNLADALHDSNVRVRHSVASPKVLIGTVLAGYLVGRLIDRSRAEPVTVGRTMGIAGMLGGLAISLLRAQLGTPGSWVNETLMQRMRARPPVPNPHADDRSGQDRHSGDGPKQTDRQPPWPHGFAAPGTPDAFTRVRQNTSGDPT